MLPATIVAVIEAFAESGALCLLMGGHALKKQLEELRRRQV